MNYFGDVNIEHGGVFYTLKDYRDGYVSAVRVTPCSDAGGPDNCFWVDRLTVNLDPSERTEALACINMTPDVWRKLRPTQRRHVWIDAALAYGFYDQEYSEMIRIGKPDPFWRDNGDRYEPSKVLRAGSSLERYARAAAREHCN